MIHTKITSLPSPARQHRKWTPLLAVLAFVGLAIGGGWLLSGCRIAHLSGPAQATFPSTTTPTSARTPTPAMIQVLTIGESVQGRPLQAARIGWGERVLVVAGAIHGSEFNTADLTVKLRGRFADSVSNLPGGVAVYFIPEVNPDGAAIGKRFNAHDIDLNRNWGTADWQPDTEGPGGAILPHGGGTAPFSEPETAALAQWLLGLRNQAGGGVTVVFYHAYYEGGAVQPGYTTDGDVLTPDPPAVALAESLAEQLGYNYIARFPAYIVTGDAINWCAENGLTCVSIELDTTGAPTRTEIDRHFQALWQLAEGP